MRCSWTDTWGIVRLARQTATYRPLVLVAASFATGILLGHDVRAIAAFAILALVSLIACRLTGSSAFRTLALLASFAAAGSFRQKMQYMLGPKDIARFATRGYVEVRGRLVDEAQEGPYYWSAHMRADSIAMGGGVLHQCDGLVMVRAAVAVDRPPPSYGQSVAVRGELAPLEEPGTPGSGRPVDVLRRQGIACQLQCRRPSGWRVVDASTDWLTRMVAWALSLRHSMRQTFLRYTSADQAELLTGIVLGGHSGLPPDLRESFRRSGILHIVAASGANVALVVGLAFLLTRIVSAVPRLRALVAVLAACTYAVAAGSQPAVVRAAVMASVFMAAPLVDRDRDGPCALAAAALAALAYDPGNLFDVGFQLSFVIVAGTMAFWPSWEALLNRVWPLEGSPASGFLSVRRLWRGWLSVIALSAIAGAYSAPITAQTFNTIPILGVVSNALVAPAVALLLPAALIGWFASLLAPTVGGLVYLAVLGPLANWIRGVATAVGSVSIATLNVPSPGWPAVAGCYLFLSALALAAYQHSCGGTR